MSAGKVCLQELIFCWIGVSLKLGILNHADVPAESRNRSNPTCTLHINCRPIPISEEAQEPPLVPRVTVVLSTTRLGLQPSRILFESQHLSLPDRRHKQASFSLDRYIWCPSLRFHELCLVLATSINHFCVCQPAARRCPCSHRFKKLEDASRLKWWRQAFIRVRLRVGVEMVDRLEQ
jgi:hypothetical protein